MEVIKTSDELRGKIRREKDKGLSIGFVPTMGALHQGHLSLIDCAAFECNFVVVSIFVNPTQFNDSKDLEKYPRQPEEDLKILKGRAVDIVFLPSVEQIYPKPVNRVFDFGILDKVMEGKFRPGHFNGVAQVVSRLFDIVSPDKAFFGEKDFQQLAIISEMVKIEKYPVKIVSCPTIREKDGLAMSSRNKLLTLELRELAPVISKSLNESRNFVHSKSPAEIIKFVSDTINDTNKLEVEYFEIVDGASLQNIAHWDESNYIVGCIAVFAGKVRLIDNVIYKKELS